MGDIEKCDSLYAFSDTGVQADVYPAANRAYIYIDAMAEGQYKWDQLSKKQVFVKAGGEIKAVWLTFEYTIPKSQLPFFGGKVRVTPHISLFGDFFAQAFFFDPSKSVIGKDDKVNVDILFRTIASSAGYSSEFNVEHLPEFPLSAAAAELGPYSSNVYQKTQKQHPYYNYQNIPICPVDIKVPISPSDLKVHIDILAGILVQSSMYAIGASGRLRFIYDPGIDYSTGLPYNGPIVIEKVHFDILEAYFPILYAVPF